MKVNVKEERGGPAAAPPRDDERDAPAGPFSPASPAADDYTDYVPSRAGSSSFEIDENSATIRHTNRKNDSIGEAVELSSLFRAEGELQMGGEERGLEGEGQGPPREEPSADAGDDEVDDGSDGSDGGGTGGSSSPRARRRRQREEGGAAHRSQKKDQETAFRSWGTTLQGIGDGEGGWGRLLMRRQSSYSTLFSSPAANVGTAVGEKSTLGSIREEGSDEEDEDPVSFALNCVCCHLDASALPRALRLFDSIFVGESWKSRRPETRPRFRWRYSQRTTVNKSELKAEGNGFSQGMNCDLFFSPPEGRT